MSAADTAFATLTARCLAVFGETVTRHNGAPDFLAERLRSDEVFGEVVQAGELTIAFPPQSAPLVRGETITLLDTTYTLAETPREHEAGLMRARLNKV